MASTIYVVRSNQDPAELAFQRFDARFRRSILRCLLANIRTFEDVIADSVAPRRLSGRFARSVCRRRGVACESVGIYGVMSFLVVQRTQEIGVRMALGAQRSDVLKLILGRSLKLISAGAAIGLVVALMSAGAVAGVAL